MLEKALKVVAITIGTFVGALLGMEVASMGMFLFEYFTN